MESPVPSKRARTSLRLEVPKWPEQRFDLKHAHFPPRILALPHVLKQIDTLLLSPNEAMVEAAGTSQADRLTELLDEYYDCCCCQRPLGGCSSDLRVRLRPRGKLSTETFEALKRAVLAAARGYCRVFPASFRYGPGATCCR